MKGTHIVALIATILWVIVLLMGFGGIESVRSQRVPGYPSLGQMRYYIYFPTVVLALIVAAWAVAVRYRPIKMPALFVILAALLCLPCYLFYYTGGV
jgi:hypothetical protein